MSQVANVILLTDSCECGVSILQKWLAENGWQSLVEISDHAGGNKAMECQVWASAFNNFDTDSFAKEVRRIEWDLPMSVHLLIKDDADFGFILRAGAGLNGEPQ